jgi:hypothetical protein
MLRSVTLPFGGLLVALALVTLAPPLARPAPAGDPPAPAPTRPIAQAERSLVGQMLVATEALQSPAFARTVVYMVRHDADGAFGLVINRPGPALPFASLLRQMQIDPGDATGRIRVHEGGPVEARRGFVLHTAEYATNGTERVADDVALTTRPDVLADIARAAAARAATGSCTATRAGAAGSSRTRSPPARGSPSPPTPRSSSTRTTRPSGPAPPPAAA